MRVNVTSQLDKIIKPSTFIVLTDSTGKLLNKKKRRDRKRETWACFIGSESTAEAAIGQQISGKHALKGANR